MKKLIIQLIISSIIVVNSTVLLFGQEKVIQGKVTTFESIPINGASIKVKSTKEVVFTDTLGMFTVSCFPKDKLKVTAGGFSNQNVKIEETTKDVLVNLNLKPGPENREMAIGYGHVKDSDRFSEMSSLNERDMDYSTYTDVYEILRGKFAGVEVRGNEIIIRGEGSLTLSNAALLVVDGNVVDESSFSSIPTVDIASINVLKGGAAARYGIRGANGVVVVETKDGKIR